jgi:NAD(P)-dependent dehydrogenase (short-subunit alcohol dehydrogenase family)
MSEPRGTPMPSPFDLQGRVAMITGACGFLGREHCDALAESGARVVVVDVDAAACSRVAEELAARRGVAVLAVATDITDRDAVQSLTRRVLERFGRIDVLVNNAQLQLASSWVEFEELAVEDWRRILDVNLTGTFLCCQAVGAHMRRERRGSIINFGSIYGMIGPDFRVYDGTPFTTAAVYSASKAGIYGLTRYLATHYGPHNVRVNAVTPGGIFNGHKDPFLGAYNERVPMRRMGEARELRGVMQFLASDASTYVTGQNIPVDGGRTAW